MKLSRALLPAVVLAVGCTSLPPPTNTPVLLAQAKHEIPDAELLDVGIQVFNPGVDEEADPAETGIFPEVREAEARFMAVQLKETMQKTGHWGAVRVVPGAVSVDLTVTATIVSSTGIGLMLDVKAVDATGRVWLDKSYKEPPDVAAFQDKQTAKTLKTPKEPFQDIYNLIANDLMEEKLDLDSRERREIRQVSELRFAADLAPAVFDEYLEQDRRGRQSVRRLPAEDDTMVRRLAQIREREYLLVDTLNQHYANFARDMSVPYDSWRKYSYEEIVALETLRRKALTQKILGALAIVGAAVVGVNSGAEAALRDLAIYGGFAAITAGIATSQEAKIHIEALQELSASFDAEVEPLVIDVEGQVMRLQGSAETQYEQWREILREIYATEIDLPADINVDESAAEAGATGG